MKKIFIAGNTGFLGSRVVKKLEEMKCDFVGASLGTGVDFRNFEMLSDYFKKERPEIVINCAAFVGGIQFGIKHEGEIFFNNTLMNANLIECSRIYSVKKFINPVSNCSYPNFEDKQFKEEEWWDGPMHQSVMVYGFVKKATWVQAYAYHRQYGMNFTTFIVPNMYGPGDHFDEERSHALGALIMKIANAKEKNLPEVIVWGTGKPVREWLYVDDCADAFIRALEIETTINPINLGQNYGISIKDMAELIKGIVGYNGKLVFDVSKQDGAPYKVMNIDKLKQIFGWYPKTTLQDGIKKTVKWYYEERAKK